MRYVVTVEIEADADDPTAAAVGAWQRIVDPPDSHAVIAVIEKGGNAAHHFPLASVASAGRDTEFRMWSGMPGGDQFPFSFPDPVPATANSVPAAKTKRRKTVRKSPKKDV